MGFGNLAINVEDGQLFTSAIFNADESALIVTQSGNPTTYTDGHLLVFPVDDATHDLSEPLIAITVRAPVPHSIVNIPNTNRVFATDIIFGTAIFDIDLSGRTVLLKNTTAIPNERHLGWSLISPATGSVYSTDAQVNRLVEQNATTGAIIGYVRGSNRAVLGMPDITGSGDKLYALSQGTRPNSTWVTVFDVSGGPGKARVLQNFRLQGFSNNATRGTYAAAAGIAVFANS